MITSRGKLCYKGKREVDTKGEGKLLQGGRDFASKGGSCYKGG